MDNDTNNIHDPEYAQTLCTSLQIALVDLLEHWGLHPFAVIGHSSGEIAAAYCAGALSKKSALQIAFYRGKLAARHARSQSADGGMMSVNLAAHEIEAYITQIPLENKSKDVVIACINSPCNVTLSGSDGQLKRLAHMLEQGKVLYRRLKVNVAYHSRAMHEIAQEYGSMIEDISIREVRSHRPLMFSSLTGGRITVHELARSNYWVDNMVSQVLFSEALSKLCSKSQSPPVTEPQSYQDTVAVTDLLEIGPHSALKGPIKDTLSFVMPEKTISYNSMLSRNVSAVTSSLASMGSLHCRGHTLRLDAVNDIDIRSSTCRTLVDLPEYPFNHTKSYWTEGRISKNYRLRINLSHELLGVPAADWNPLNARWRQRIRLNDLPWMADHKVWLFVSTQLRY